MKISLPVKLDLNLKLDYKLILPPVILFLVLLLVMPRSAKFNYDYRKGSEWQYETLVAQFDFPILKTQEQIMEEKSKTGSSVIPYYKFADEVVSRNLKSVESLSFGKYNSIKGSVISALNDIYSRGVVSDQGVKGEKNADPMSDDVLFIQKDKRATKYPVTEVYKVSDAKTRLMSVLSKQYTSINIDSVLVANGVYDFIAPNLIYDKQTTSLVHSESSRYVSPALGYVNAGQLIVSNGEIVTGEIAQMLDSYKVEFENNMGYGGPTILFWGGNAILSLTLVVLLLLVIYLMNPVIFTEFNRYSYLHVIFLIAAVTSIIMARTGSDLVYLVPFTLTALYLQAFFQNKVILPICLIALLPLMMFAQNGIVLYVMFTFAGIIHLQLFKTFNKGWMQFVGSFIIFLVLVVVYFGFRMVDLVSGNPLKTVLLLFAGSMASTFLYAFIFAFEKIFNLVSNSRLLDLCDTNAPLIRELEKAAPGTLQHSRSVMSMAEAVARSIDANVTLVRAAALYHDLGKMNNPQCFVENESINHGKPEDKKYHYSISPEQSASDIIKHVTDGVEIAKKNGLPDILCDFIVSHHGTTTVAYFYRKYVEMGGDPANKAMFTYPGRKPVSKEQVILMLCDSIEAASRTVKDHSPEAFSDFVEAIVNGKMAEAQFTESDITIKELGIVKDVLKQYLGQVNHERISYNKK